MRYIVLSKNYLKDRTPWGNPTNMISSLGVIFVSIYVPCQFQFSKFYYVNKVVNNEASIEKVIARRSWLKF